MGLWRLGDLVLGEWMRVRGIGGGRGRLSVCRICDLVL
jgi:hypothetical protein